MICMRPAVVHVTTMHYYRVTYSNLYMRYKYTVFQKELYNFERVYRFIQMTYTMFLSVRM
jgi:hypothetical protein